MFVAYSIASLATAEGSAPYFCAITFTPNLLPCSCNCSIAPALCVSAAAKTTLIPFFLSKLAILAIVVVLPVPLVPKNNITNEP